MHCELKLLKSLKADVQAMSLAKDYHVCTCALHPFLSLQIIYKCLFLFFRFVSLLNVISLKNALIDLTTMLYPGVYKGKYS